MRELNDGTPTTIAELPMSVLTHPHTSRRRPVGGGGGDSPVMSEARTIGKAEPPLDGPILIVDYDARWPTLFELEAARIRTVLGGLALRIEHTGSTSVPGLAAKPIIDLVLAVADSADEAAYVPALQRGGYTLLIREPDWYRTSDVQRARRRHQSARVLDRLSRDRAGTAVPGLAASRRRRPRSVCAHEARSGAEGMDTGARLRGCQARRHRRDHGASSRPTPGIDGRRCLSAAWSGSSASQPSAGGESTPRAYTKASAAACCYALARGLTSCRSKNPAASGFMLRALRYRNYRLFFGGQIVSLVGTWITTTAHELAGLPADRLGAPARRRRLRRPVPGVPARARLPASSSIAGTATGCWSSPRSISMLQSFALAALTLQRPHHGRGHHRAEHRPGHRQRVRHARAAGVSRHDDRGQGRPRQRHRAQLVDGQRGAPARAVDCRRAHCGDE